MSEQAQRPRTYSGVIRSMCADYTGVEMAFEEYKSLVATNRLLTRQTEALRIEIAQLNEQVKSKKKTKNKNKRTKEQVKRHRRLARDIERHYKCQIWAKCFGSEGSLNQHIKLKHLDDLEDKN